MKSLNAEWDPVGLSRSLMPARRAELSASLMFPLLNEQPSGQGGEKDPAPACQRTEQDAGRGEG